MLARESEIADGPIVARRSVKLLFAALLSGSIGLLFSIGFAVTLYSVYSVFAGEELQGINLVVVIPLGVTFGIFGYLFIGSAAVAVADYCRKSPLLRIDVDSISDLRLSRMSIAWTAVEHAKLISSRMGPIGVTLRLRGRAPFRSNRLRIGCWVRRDPRDVCVATALLGGNTRLMAAAIIQRVKAAGGTVDTSSWSHPISTPTARDDRSQRSAAP
jgi:hypothetical protein